MEVFFATNHGFPAANLIMYKDIVVTLYDRKGYLSRMAYMFSFMVILFLLMGYIFVQMHLHYNVRDHLNKTDFPLLQHFFIWVLELECYGNAYILSANKFL